MRGIIVASKGSEAYGISSRLRCNCPWVCRHGDLPANEFCQRTAGGLIREYSHQNADSDQNEQDKHAHLYHSSVPLEEIAEQGLHEFIERGSTSAGARTPAHIVSI